MPSLLLYALGKTNEQSMFSKGIDIYQQDRCLATRSMFRDKIYAYQMDVFNQIVFIETRSQCLATISMFRDHIDV